ncbi:ABC transporter permease [Cohnella sp. CIP 111063]|uniref:carbohydrate ABC transporter permease n=1 Tax=unclassified Cohnella TaxID=2636738 RepID=UPI000B8C0F12|nr:MULTISPECIES: carbohydrate ABC transporter permease [unclassified Cohnella]OXS53540.1 ABC transporter permease [Cohnella sp. CIP 111063]PRX61565.1 putative aldouronate transport system permease protein [Cohnella sp. SGD-V74]
MKQFAGDRIFNGLNVLLLSLVALVTFFPIYYVLVVSFTDPSEYMKNQFIVFPQKWSTISYEYLLSSKAFVNSLGASAYLAVVGTLCSLVVSSALAYGLSRRRLRGRRFLMLFILITILFQPGIIPNYMLIRQLDLINSYWAIILPALTSGWNVLLMKGFFDSLPDELEEAASIDGCNDISTWIRIILPLSLPALAAFGLFFAVAYWNTYFNALLYITNSAKWPIQVILQNMLISASTGDLLSTAYTEKPPSQTLKMAAVIIATVPILFVYPFLQKHFAKGALIGSVKG